MPFNLLFRDDIFISYSRGDGGAYAVGLADKLTAKKYSCFTDRLGAEPDHELPRSLKKKIRNCTLMVLVGTEHGAASRFVAEEISEFKKTKRTIVPVDFGGAVGRAAWYGLIPGLAAEPEDNPDALKSGEPSPNVISRIEKSFNYTRRNMRMLRLLVVTTAVLLLLIAASAAASVIASRKISEARDAQAEAAKQSRIADGEKARAEEQAKRAKDEEEKAKAASAKAEEMGEKALKAQEDARLAQERAEVAKAEADKQTKIANAQTKRAEEEAKRVERLRYDGDVKLAEQRYEESSDTKAVEGFVTRYEPKPDARGLRGFEFYYLKHLLSPELFRGTHAAAVAAVKFSPDGRMLASASEDFKVNLWEVRPGAAPEGAPTQLDISAMKDSPPRSDFSLDFRMVFSPCGEGPDSPCGEMLAFINGPKLGLWRVSGEKLWEQRSVGGERPPLFRLVSFLSDKMLATLTEHVESDNNLTLELRDVKTGAVRKTWQIGRAGRYAFSPDGKLLATAKRWFHDEQESASIATTAEVWDVAEGKVISTWDMNRVDIYGMTFSGNAGAGRARWLALQEVKINRDATKDVAVAVRHVESGTEVSRIKLAARVGSWHGLVMAYSRDGHRLATAASAGGDASALRLWSGTDGEPLSTFRADFGTVKSVEFSPDGRMVATGGGDKALRLWSLTNEPLQLADARKYDIFPVWLSPDKRSLVGENSAGEILTWDASGVGQPSVVRAAGYRNYAVSLDGRRVVRGDEWEKATVRNARTGDVLFEPNGVTVAEPPIDIPQVLRNGNTGIEFSPDDRMLATTSESPDGGFVVRVWNVGERRRVGSLRVDAYPLVVRFSHDGGRLAVVADGAAVLWNPQSEPDGPGLTLAEEGCEMAAFSWDSKRLAVGTDGGDVKVWSVLEPYKAPVVLHPTYTPEYAGLQAGETGRVVVNSLDFSPDGERLAVVYSERLLRIWDVATAEQLIKIEDGEIHDVSFLPDGRRLLTFHPGSDVKLWPPDAKTEWAVRK